MLTIHSLTMGEDSAMVGATATLPERKAAAGILGYMLGHLGRDLMAKYQSRDYNAVHGFKMDAIVVEVDKHIRPVVITYFKIIISHESGRPQAAFAAKQGSPPEGGFIALPDDAPL